MWSIHGIAERIKRKLDASQRKIDLYQIGTDAAEGKGEEFGGEFAAEGEAAGKERGKERCATGGGRVEDEDGFGGGGEAGGVEGGDGLFGWMLAGVVLPGCGR